MEFSTYRQSKVMCLCFHLVQHLEGWQTRDPERSSDLPEVTQPEHCIAGTQIWYPSVGTFSLAPGRYLSMRAESLYGFQPRPWKLYPWFVSLLADHMTCELVSDKLLEQEVFHSTHACSVASRGMRYVWGSPVYPLSFLQTKLRIDCVYSNSWVVAAFFFLL